MDIQEMMKQAQVMQQKMQDMQEQLGALEVTGESGGGLVKAVMTCRGELKKLDIANDVIVPEEKETMEDLIVAAINSARLNADNKMASETQKLMQEFGLPANTELPGSF